MTTIPDTDRYPYVDTHCHLDLYADPSTAIERARDRGVALVAVTNTPSVFRVTQLLAEATDNVLPALGLHPELANEREEELRLLPQLIPSTRFIGEVGLDSSPSNRGWRSNQMRVLRAFLEACREAQDKILSVHSRRASGPLLDALGENFPGIVILHWYTGSVANVRKGLARGYYFSINTAMCRTQKGLELLRLLPRERVLTESDGPLSGRHGHPTWPDDVIEVVDFLAKRWNLHHEEARDIISQNFTRCLG